MSGGSKLEAYIADLADKVSRPGELRVGFLEGATYPDGTSVPLVAAVQNFGAPSRGIPPRPFFSNAIDRNAEGWGPALAAILPTVDYDGPAALRLMGEGIKGQVQQSIRDTNAPPLADSTVKRKGFKKPLIDTSHMINSVDWEVRE
jgi:hypothetical protein